MTFLHPANYHAMKSNTTTHPAPEKRTAPPRKGITPTGYPCDRVTDNRTSWRKRFQRVTTATDFTEAAR